MFRVRINGAANAFGVTLDLDAFDPQVAPGVGSPGLRALAVFESNPDRGCNGITASLMGGLIGDLVKQFEHHSATTGQARPGTR